MASARTIDVARRAKALYQSEFQSDLEAHHRDAFVAIEPDSKEFFVADTLSAAIQAARDAHPNRLAFALRIGHPSAVNIGLMTS